VKQRKWAHCGIFAAVISICAWLSFGSGVVFTMQSFAVCLCLQLLGGKWGTVSILSYLLIGAVGLPVFSGFRGGPGALLGATGGFLFGFLAMGLIYWLVQHLCKNTWLALLLGFLGLYACGILWYGLLYAPQSSWGSVFLICVAPYLLPDGLKLAASVYLAKQIRKHI
jgi:biotin transport system substrate-specific component